ncbi:MAG: ATP-dependent protease, partial [Candidatus Aureabacteria bacterium]|nr:ATP-dependent protease [Candidatus Auribacterota bacterium]
MTENTPPKKPPDLQEMVKDLSDYVHKKYGGQPLVTFAPSIRREAPKRPEAAAESFTLEFNYTPKQVKEYLDRFVIRQEEAKKVISIAVCDHYPHAMRAKAGKEE